MVSGSRRAKDDAAAGRDAASGLDLGATDVVVSVAASGTTPFTCAVQAAARAAGALTVALANNPGTPLLAGAEHPVPLPTGAEFLAGSTRMAAGTAQKMALNLFSTRVMTELGRVYRGRMVQVVPSNAKLVARAHRIVAELTGAAPDDRRQRTRGGGRRHPAGGADAGRAQPHRGAGAAGHRRGRSAPRPGRLSWAAAGRPAS